MNAFVVVVIVDGACVAVGAEGEQEGKEDASKASLPLSRRRLGLGVAAVVVAAGDAVDRSVVESLRVSTCSR